MALPKIFKPDFWDDYEISQDTQRRIYHFRRIWEFTVLLTLGVAIIPLVILVLLDYNVTRNAYEREILLRTSRLVNNIGPTVTFFLAERKSALDLIVHEHPYEELKDQENLGNILENLKKSFGGFADLGVIDANGLQQVYAGPFELTGKDYHNEEWFRQMLTHGVYISDVFLGFRNIPHIVTAIRHSLPQGSFYVLRTTLDMEKFNSLLSQFEISGLGDTFIVNHEGIIQTPSRNHGKVLERISLPIPRYSTEPQVVEEVDKDGETVLIGYAYIEQTPFILMLVNDKKELMKPWYEAKVFLVAFLAVSITVITIVILSITTYLVKKIHGEEKKREVMLHQLEYSNKLASLGRLAAGVAHEINNPLAIINEKAGLIKDIFTYTSRYQHDEKLLKTVDSIKGSVERCSKITRRLLRFARHMDVSIQQINLKELFEEVLGFMDQEAKYRSIEVVIDIQEDALHIESDRGKLQQILLNLINNAFSALDDGGRLELLGRQRNEKCIEIKVKDNGCGISSSDLDRIFEPFYSTKTKEGGTGLGLSITYGLVKEIGGNITLESMEGVGTTFTIELPFSIEKKWGNEYADTLG